MMTTRSPELLSDAAQRIRWCLVVFNILLIIFGVVEIVLGCVLCYHVVNSTKEDVPQLWMIGVPQLIIGVIGIASLIHAQKIIILAWLITSSIMVPLSFMLFTMSDCFNTAIFWVHLQVFGQCTTFPQICKCFWNTSHERMRTVVHEGSCEDIRYATSLYLSVIGLLIISLVITLVNLGMGYIMTTCIQYCIPKELRPLYTSCSTANGLEASGFYKSSLKAETPPIGKCNTLTVPLVEVDQNSTGSDRRLIPS